MPAFATLMLAFAVSANSLIAGPVEVVADGFQFTEGPVWTSKGELIFSDIPADAVYRADKSVVFQPSGKSNGMALDGEGRIIRCEHDNRRVVRVEHDGSLTVLADAHAGKKLNSPNDAVWHRRDIVFFTDPPYGLEGREQEQPANGVYAIHADGRVTLVAGDFIRPNGIALSPEDRTLYVADTEGNHIRTFKLAEDGSVSGGGAVLCSLPTPDGIRVDTKGNLWATSTRGVVLFNKRGRELHVIAVPQVPTNCGFGGPDGKTLYITAQSGVYRVKTHATGLVGGWKR